jgi:aspartyl-tRNA(Asn)/glutamyl-tRNA(Gln) amidotransferase subunit B
MELGVIQESDEGALSQVIEEVIAAHPSVVEEYRRGKTSSLQYLVGQAMKASKGAGNPRVLAELLSRRLSV